MIKAVAFDLDNTLIDIETEGIKNILKKIHKELKLEELTKEEIERMWFKPNRDGFIEDKFGIKSKDYWKVFNKYYTIDGMKNYTKLFFDIYALKTLKEKGKKIGILTSSSSNFGHYKIGLIEEKLGKIIDYFLFIREHNIPDKPNPIGLEMLMKKLNVHKNEIVFVGDCDCDTETAHNAGVISMLIERDHNQNGLISIRPNYRFNNLYQIRCYI